MEICNCTGTRKIKMGRRGRMKAGREKVTLIQRRPIA